MIHKNACLLMLVPQMEDAVNTWSLPIGYYFRSSYQFKVAYENTVIYTII